jgi:hypothetical protein
MEENQRPILIDHTLADDCSLDELQIQKFSESCLDITSDQALQLGKINQKISCQNKKNFYHKISLQKDICLIEMILKENMIQL